MILNSMFEITEVSGEYMAIPLTTISSKFNGVVALNEASAFLLKYMNTSKTRENLVDLLIANYDVAPEIATRDVDIFVKKMIEVGVILNNE